MGFAYGRRRSSSGSLPACSIWIRHLQGCLRQLQGLARCRAGPPTSGELRSMRHRFHSLCPYFAMFPETFAEYWIKKLTKPEETVLDPFSGRGTTALTALLCGRNAISSDVNDVAGCLTQAKPTPPSLSR